LSGSVYLNLPETRVSLLKFGMWKRVLRERLRWKKTWDGWYDLPQSNMK
jgi:hypothetical protein